jgi:osmotically-inducible protein OsmY
MSGHDAIIASGVSDTPIKISAGSSGSRLTSSLGNVTSDESIDRQPIEENNYTMSERIRKEIVADKRLSLCAQNIEISVGRIGVTLNGTVKSHEEREKVEAAVATVVNVSKVFNKLIVRSGQDISHAKSSQLQDTNCPTRM